MDSIYLIDDFVATRPGDPYRLFPFGRIVKNGKVREITPELAARFRLPHFKPPIKLGSHEEPTPAGGHFVKLEVRNDGLYGYPEWNDKGVQAMNDGAYRYHSPEVIWEDGAMENPETGEYIEGPLIVGDALLHMPHLGEAARLYGVEPIAKGDNTMTVETVNVPKNIWDKFTAWLDRMSEPPAEPETPEELQVKPDEFDAVVKERDDFRARLEAIEAEKERAARVEKFESELKDTKADPELAALLADLTDEQAERITREIKALSAQAAELDGEQGSEGEAITEPAAAFDAAIRAVMEEKKVLYHQAFEIVKAEQPELFNAYAKGE